MILYRYMGITELMRFLRGNIIQSYNYDDIHFLSEKTKVYLNKNDSSDMEEFDPVTCLEFMEGIVTKDILCKFEAKEDLVRPKLARYANPYMASPYMRDDRCNIIEYTCDTYNNKDFKLISLKIITNDISYHRYNKKVLAEGYKDHIIDLCHKNDFYKHTSSMAWYVKQIYDLYHRSNMRKWRCKYDKSMDNFISIPEILKNTSK